MKKNFGILLGAIFLLSGCGKSFEKSIIGKWTYEVSESMEGEEALGKLTMRCLSEYFPNQSVNHECDLKIIRVSKTESERVSIEGTYRGSGEWSVADKTLLDKSVDAKVDISKVTENDQAVTDQEQLEQMRLSLNNIFVKGETISSTTTFFDGKKWVFDQEVDKKKISVTATRQ